MAQRSMRNPRFPMAQVTSFGRLTPTLRAVVSPGETMKELRAAFRIQSLPVKYAMTGCSVECHWFYVPFRVAWPEFPDWLINPDSSETLPVLDGSNYNFTPAFFEREDGQRSALFHLCYEKIVNEYFRSDEMPQYSVPATGNRLAVAPLLDMTGEAMGSADDTDFDVEVDTSSGSFTLGDFEDKHAEYMYAHRRSEMDGKYTTYLNRMGVRVSETALDIPERLGQSRKFVWPSKSIDESTGRTVQSFFHDVRVRLRKPRYFMEHGLVIGLVVLRPKVLLRGVEVVDVLFNDPEDFPVFDQLTGQKRHEGQALTSITGDDQVFTWDNFLYRGQHLVGHDSPASEFSLSYAPSTFEELRLPEDAYADMVDTTTHDTLGGQHMCVDGFSALRVASPLRRELIE